MVEEIKSKGLGGTLSKHPPPPTPPWPLNSPINSRIMYRVYFV